MKRIHELACIEAKKIAGVSLLARGRLVGGDSEPRQCLRRKQTIRKWHRQDVGFSAHADAHFFADTKPKPKCPQDAVKAKKCASAWALKPTSRSEEHTSELQS